MTTTPSPLPHVFRSVCAAVLLSTCGWYAQAQTPAPATPDTSALTELLRANQPEQAMVELDKLLKRENIAASGGEARWMISDRLVQVNGELELRKRRKLYPGDLVVVQGKILRIVAITTPDVA